MFSCEVCGKSYTKNRHLRLHFARNHVDKSEWTDKCDVCGKVYADAEILQRHALTHHNLGIKCPIEDCNEEFPSQLAMHKHRKSHFSKDFENLKEVKAKKKKYCCEECDMSFAKHHLLTQHSYIHTNVLPFKCTKCETAFLTLAHRNRHEKVHNGYKCDQCNQRFDTWTDLRSHVSKEHPRRFPCTKCDKTFRMACRLREHMVSHGEVRKLYKCKECDRTFVKKFNLKTHIKIQHENVKTFKCPTEGCLKVFAHNHSLKKHMVTHAPDYVRPTRKRSDKPARKARKGKTNKISLLSQITGIKPKIITVGV
ncbi:unnamed protein product [Clavelina lepadiformis]|uniref:C2H2-type domain-containing protein n=1 Tax=Clavelina lepadiformis TaxID=159417 RepID=A0ABP0FZN2_CLALP